MKPIIILTSTVNVNYKKSYLFQTSKEDRLETYLKSIKQWLYKTNLMIILVENSGYPFNELEKEKELFKDRFQVLTFKENEFELSKYLENNDSKGASEMFSINYAFFYSQLIHKDSFIIKITGRFFIPELEEYLNTYDLNNYDCLVQNNRNRCEIVGSHYNNFLHIFKLLLLNNKNQYNPHVETIYLERTSEFKNILICKNFEIEKTQRGGENECFTCL